MSKLYDIIEKVINAKDMDKAEELLYGREGIQINSREYYEKIIANFVKKKDYILPKINDNIIFDLDENIKDIWDIIFISQYIQEQWNKQRKEIKKEIEKIKQNLKKETNQTKKIELINKRDKLLESVNKINEYFQDIEKIKELNKINLETSKNINNVKYQKELYELKKAIRIIQKIRNSFEHRDERINIDKIIKIDNENNRFKISIPSEYLEGFAKGRIIIKEEDKYIIKGVNDIVYPLLEELRFDPKKLENFFYNVNPKNLSTILEYCNNNIQLLYQLSSELFCEEGVELLRLVSNGSHFSKEDVLILNKLTKLDEFFIECESKINRKEINDYHLSGQVYYYKRIKKLIEKYEININLKELLYEHFKNYENDTQLFYLHESIKDLIIWNEKINKEEIEKLLKNKRWITLQYAYDFNTKLLNNNEIEEDFSSIQFVKTIQDEEDINNPNNYKNNIIIQTIVNYLKEKNRNLTESEMIKLSKECKNYKNIKTEDIIEYIKILYGDDSFFDIYRFVRFISRIQEINRFSPNSTLIQCSLKNLIFKIKTNDEILSSDDLDFIIKILYDENVGTESINLNYEKIKNNLSKKIKSDIELKRIMYSIPTKVYTTFDLIHYDNLEYLINIVNNEYERLDEFPIEFFTCDYSLLDEMCKRYDSNLCKSIFGINNPKIIGLLIYTNSVLSEYSKNNPDNINIDIDIENIMKSAAKNTIKYKDNITVINMNGNKYVDQFLYDDEVSKKTRNNEEIRKHILEKLRNATAHFRFKLVKDNNGNIIDDKIYLYDQDNMGNNNFNIIIDIKNLLSIVRDIELEMNKIKTANTNYNNSGYKINNKGEYYNPYIDDYDSNYNPIQDKLFNEGKGRKK